MAIPSTPKQPVALAFKPDLAAAARRWEAFYTGEIIDRPVVCVTAPREGLPRAKDSDYHTWARSPAEADALLAWFVQYT